MNPVILITMHFNNVSNLPYDVYKQRKLKYTTGFELAVCICNLRSTLTVCEWAFAFFSKNCKSRKSNTSWIFRVIHWTSYIESYFKSNKYTLLNNNVISQRFIIHITSSHILASFLTLCYDLTNCKPVTSFRS